jgi:hypothetical protein
MKVSVPTTHQMAVVGSHVVVYAGGAISALAFFGALDHSQVIEATNDIKRISSDSADIIGAVSSLAAIAMAAYSTLKSGPLASFFRAANTIAQSPVLTAQVQQASILQKAPVVTITDKMPEVVGIPTANTPAGDELALSVPSATVKVGTMSVIKVLVAALALASLVGIGSSQAEPVRHTTSAPALEVARTEPAAPAFPTLQSYLPKPHLLKLLNPLGLPDPMCITDHPSQSCPTDAAAVAGGGMTMTGQPNQDFANFIKRGGIVFIRDMMRADQFFSYPCGSTATAGCVKTDVLSSSCIEAIIPVAKLIVNGPPSLADSSAPAAAPSTTPSTPTTPVAVPADTAPLMLNGLPAVKGANGVLMSTDSPAITSADDGVVTAGAKLDMVFIALTGPALKQGCGGWVQDKVQQGTNFAASLMTFVTTLGLTGL